MTRGSALQRLTTSLIKRLATDKPRGLRITDTVLSGFGVTVYSSGKKTFWLRYGPRNRRRFVTIGTFGIITVDQARAKARQLLAQFELGADPIEETRKRRAVPTLGEWIDTYLEQAVREQKPSTFKSTRLRLAAARRFFGDIAVDEITRARIQEERLKLAEASGSTSANRWLSVLRCCLTEAVARGHLAGNPATGIKRLRENPPRQRILSEEEMARLTAAIDEHADPSIQLAFRLLIGTGARVSEVLNARWDDLNLKEAKWRLPDPKSGHPQTILLSQSVGDILATTQRLDSPWLIPSKTNLTKRLRSLNRAWRTLCATASIKGAVQHDLRRTFGARIARQSGLQVASRLLRHSDIRVTESVYAPIDEQRLREALAASEEQTNWAPPLAPETP